MHRKGNKVDTKVDGGKISLQTGRGGMIVLYRICSWLLKTGPGGEPYQQPLRLSSRPSPSPPTLPPTGTNGPFIYFNEWKLCNYFLFNHVISSANRCKKITSIKGGKRQNKKRWLINTRKYAVFNNWNSNAVITMSSASLQWIYKVST